MRSQLLPILLAFSAGAVAQTTCRLGDIPMSGTVEGSFQTNDCQGQRYLGDVPDTGRAQGWVLTATTPVAVYHFRLAASQAPARLYLNNLSSTLAGAEATTQGQEAELNVQLTPGRYLLVAVSGSNNLGAYTLTSENRPLRQCDTIPLAPGADLEATLSTDACPLTEFLPRIARNTPVDLYRLSVDKPLLVTVVLTSPDFTPDYAVITEKNEIQIPQEGNAAISVDPGSYRLLVTSKDGKLGNYRIRIDSEDRRPCPPAALNSGTRVAGQLDSAGCRLLDAFPGQSDARPVNLFEFELSAPTLTAVTLISREVDTELYLLDNKQVLLASNDDADVTTTNSQVGLSLAPGKYKVVAASADGKAGAFEALLGTEAPRPCAAVSLNLPGATSASLTSAGCRYVDAVQPSSSGAPAAVFTFNIAKPTVTGMAATSASFTPSIELRSAAGALLSSSTRSSQIAQLLIPGDYQAIVSSGGTTGNITVTTATRDPLACAATTLTTDGTPVPATLDGSACVLRELVPLPVGATASNLYSVDVDSAGRVRFAVETTAFVPSLLVLSPEGKVIAAALAQVEADVQPGRYHIVVTTGSPNGGDYKVTAVALQRPNN